MLPLTDFFVFIKFFAVKINEENKHSVKQTKNDFLLNQNAIQGINARKCLFPDLICKQGV